MSDSAIKVDRRQDEEGQPYYHYFDPESELTFVWSGKHNEHIQITQGDYGPVIDQISPSSVDPANFMPSALGWLQWFEHICVEYLEVRNLVKED